MIVRRKHTDLVFRCDFYGIIKFTLQNHQNWIVLFHAKL